jgi:hypothetical protein
MHASYRSQKLLVILIPFLLSLLATGASAQAKKTADRRSEFDAFGGFSYINSDYLAPYGNFGGTIGGDYTPRFIPRYQSLIVPSFQIRGTLANGPSVNEKTIEGGIRIGSTYRNFHPYVDLLAGQGIINFNYPQLKADGTLYKRDSTFIYVYGGGVTFDVKNNFSIMADFQQQYWDLGEHPPVRFYPYAATIGIRYRIPFKAYKTR